MRPCWNVSDTLLHVMDVLLITITFVFFSKRGVLFIIILRGQISKRNPLCWSFKIAYIMEILFILYFRPHIRRMLNTVFDNSLSLVCRCHLFHNVIIIIASFFRYSKQSFLIKASSNYRSDHRIISWLDWVFFNVLLVCDCILVRGVWSFVEILLIDHIFFIDLVNGQTWFRLKNMCVLVYQLFLN